MLEIINQAVVGNKDLRWLREVLGSFYLKKEAGKIKNLHLPPEVGSALDAYLAAGGQRDDFILKWTFKGLDNLTLGCVDPALKEQLLTTKLLIIIEDYCLDDIADKFQDRYFLDLVIGSLQKDNLPGSNPQIGNNYGQFCLELWRKIKNEVKKYPRFAEFKNLFRHYNDLFWETLSYSLTINQNPEIIKKLSLDDHQQKSAHNMNGLIIFTVDLMGSPSFDVKELALTQKAVENAQMMGRIGNSMTTWERELKDHDFTSDVFVWSVLKNVVTIKELRNEDPQIIREKINHSGVYEIMFVRWKKHRQEIVNLVDLVKSVDLRRYLNGLDQLFMMHLASQGLK